MDYIARTSNHGNESCVEHLSMVGCIDGAFSSTFGEMNEGICAGIMHDIGKYSCEFQNMIRHPDEPHPIINHSSAGMLEASNMGLQHAEFSIAGHHAGLPDGGGRFDDENSGTLMARLKRPFPDYHEWKNEIKVPNTNVTRPMDSMYSMMMRTRMHESCLVDADRLDAEYYTTGGTLRDETELLDWLKHELLESGIQDDQQPSTEDIIRITKLLHDKMRSTYDGRIEELSVIVDNRYKELISVTSSSKLNKNRNQLLESCMTMGSDRNNAPGVYTLTAPTGSGKTDSSVTFAIKHAKTNRMDRIIYVAPYTSIIDQTADDYEKLFGEKNVLPCYSDVSYNLNDHPNRTDYKRTLAAENWNSPIVVTTSVQFFETLYANGASKLRKLHNMANSVIIIDEAQTLPLPLLKPCITAMAELVRNYHSTIVLCTATQPALDEFFKNELGDQLIIKEIAPTDESWTDGFRRNSIEDMGLTTISELAAELSEKNQVLCVMNTRLNAQATADAIRSMSGDDGVYCLTTYLCPNDRRKTINEIRCKLRTGQPCKVVSTSLIEAGVDIDFPMAYREEAGLDSILQTAGRCNREGKSELNESKVIVFRLSNKPAYVRQASNVYEEINTRYGDVTSNRAVESYFKELFRMRGDEQLDRNGILRMHEHGASGRLMPFQTIASMFKMIGDDGVTVYLPLNSDAVGLIRELKDPDKTSRSTIRRLGQYSVGIRSDQAVAMLGRGQVEKIDDATFVLKDEACYNDQYGLTIDGPSTGYQY